MVTWDLKKFVYITIIDVSTRNYLCHYNDNDNEHSAFSAHNGVYGHHTPTNATPGR